MTHPKQLDRSLVLVLLALVDVPNGSIAENHSLFPSSCPEFCQWHNVQLSDADVNGNVWCHSKAFPETPYQTTLPQCKNVTVHRSAASKLLMQEHHFRISLQDHQLSEDNQTVSICYNLSPQLLNCNLKLLDRRQYAYVEFKLALKNCRTKEFVALGDFYVLPGNDSVIVCNETLGYHLDMASRCQFIDLEAKEYEWLDDNTTLRLLPSNRTIHGAYYYLKTAYSSNITVCYPLSNKMTKCKRDTLYPHEYKAEFDRRIYNLRSRKYLNFGDYLLLGDYQIDNITGEVQFCKDEETYTCVTPMLATYALSIIALILTIAIHALFPSINHHAMPLLCQMFSMAVFYFTMFYLLLWHPETRSGSYILFAFRYYSALATYFWLNVLSFDLWRVFANLRNSSQPQSNKGKYIFYCAYAFGIPLTLTIFCLVLEIDSSVQDATGFYPDIRDNYWFKEFKSNLTFYAGPIALQLGGNVIFFAFTVCNLKQAFECVQAVNKERYKQLFSVSMKIFFTTGLSWVITESVPFWAGGLIRYIAWILSCSQGVLIFIIYICKPYTYRIIRKKMEKTSLSTWKISTSTMSVKGNGQTNSSSSGIGMESTTVDDISTQEITIAINSTGQSLQEVTQL